MPSRTCLPSSFKSGFPLASVAEVKKRGWNSTFNSFLLVALSRCTCSRSCLILVASPKRFSRIADVTSFQNVRDSFGSCSSGGGTILGTGIRGAKSIRSCLSEVGSRSFEPFTASLFGIVYVICSCQQPSSLAKISFSGTSFTLTYLSSAGSYRYTTPCTRFWAFPNQLSST